MNLKKIIVWGTGDYANIFVKDFEWCNEILHENFGIKDIRICYFIDNNIANTGKKLYNLEIKKPNILNDKNHYNDEFIVIATPFYYHEIALQLIDKGLREDYHFIHYKYYFTKLIKSITTLNDEDKKVFYRKFLDKTGTISRQDNLISRRMADVYCELGFALLKDNNNNQVDGIECLIKSFDFSHRKKEIYEFFYKCYYEKKSYMIKETYNYNVKVLNEICKFNYNIDFANLSIRIFPISQDNFLIHNKISDNLIFIHTLGNLENKSYFSLYDAYVTLMTKQIDSNDVELCCQIRKIEQMEKSYILIAKIEENLNNSYDKEDIIVLINEYRCLCPYSEKYYWMMGKYYFNRKEYSLAKKYAIEGYSKRKLDHKICLLMGEIYFNLNEYAKAIRFFLLSDIKNLQFNLSYNFDIDNYMNLDLSVRNLIERCLKSAMDISENLLNLALAEMSEGCTHYRHFPLLHKFYFYDNRLCVKTIANLGRQINSNFDKVKYFLGLTGNQNIQVGLYRSIEQLLQRNVGNTILLDVVKAHMVKDFQMKSKNETYLLPLMPTHTGQKIDIDYKNKIYKYDSFDEMYARFNAFKLEYFQINNDIRISSDNMLIVGEPIKLKKDKKKKKLVLNILIDTVSFCKINSKKFLCPNIMKFFNKGMMFYNNYAPAEWTIPSVPSIFTGVYQDKTQIFHPAVPISIKLDPKWKTIAELMAENGYYSLNLSTALHSFEYSDVYRGFDRSIGHTNVDKDILIMHCLNYMRIFEDNSLFINMHLMDVHDSISYANTKMTTMSNVDIGKILDLDEVSHSKSKSIHMQFSEVRDEIYEKEIEKTDFALGKIFDFLEENYKNDEYIVSLCSDHGAGFFGRDNFTLKDELTHVPLMIRGNGVRNLGVIDNEVTNTIDLYSIYAHLCDYCIDGELDCRLPKAFGGRGREYSITQSLYPGQTYKMVINTLLYTFNLETQNLTTVDGRICMDSFSYDIFSKKENMKKVFDKEIVNYFIKIAMEHTKRLDEPNYFQNR